VILEVLGRHNKLRGGGPAAAKLMVALLAIGIAAGVLIGPTAFADPASDSDLIRPLPVITPKSSNWAPKFPFPYDSTKGSVTGADITAEREMCQWFTAQYSTLSRQIDRFQFNRIGEVGTNSVNGNNGVDWDYSVNGVQQQADIVLTNIDQSLAFLAPRAQALTQSQNYVGDNYFPLYEGEAFFKLWQELSNVSAGIKAHQPDWFTGPSVRIAKRWGSHIQHSHVCD
jgi:hypothetical protein